MKTKVFNLIILDESGSMSCIERQALNGLNETLQTIRRAQDKFPEQEQLVSIVPFESGNIRLLRDKVSIKEVNDLRPDEYNPGACTPLYDAIGFGINPGALRTRTSRLCANVKRLVCELNDALIASLNRQSLDIAKEIYDEAEPDIEAILEELLDKAERELDQYDQIVELRKEKRNSIRTFENLMYPCMAEMSTPGSCFDMDERSCMPEMGNHIVRMFKELIGM